MATIPPYVFEFAPKVWLHSKDPYFPSDIGAQLRHTTPKLNFATVAGAPPELTLDNLDSLNSLAANPQDIYLTSNDDVTKDPAWLKGVAPDATTGKTEGAITGVIIVTDHGSGKVDAFYMYFYAFNQGNQVFGMDVGCHVGDWEHNMIRFNNGQPEAIWYSQHATGQAFTYAAVEKEGKRPIVYSAKGSHANYTTPGSRSHSIPHLNLPFGLILDHCDRGRLWDPILSAYMYSYNPSDKTFTPAPGYNPVGFLKFRGRWGDQRYPNSDRRQRRILGISATAKYGDGPTGPEDKQLNRTNVCPDNGQACIIRPVVGP